VACKTIGMLNFRSQSQKLNTLRRSLITHLEGSTIAFFDRASIRGGTNCEVGGVIKILDLHVFKWHINCGVSTNTKTELMGGWVNLTLAKLWKITKIQLMGYSKVIIDWQNQKFNLHAIDIKGWNHIFNDYNKEADRLSKQGMLDQKGNLTYYIVDDGTSGPLFHLKLF
jgi:hypothetical protein